MTDKYEALREAIKGATPGPWYDVPHPEWSGSPHHITPRRDEDWVQSIGRTTASPRDAAYIAAANPAAILELLATNERLVDEVAELKAAYESQFKELHELKAELEDAKQAARTWENEAERRSDRYTKCAAELERIKALEPVAWCLGNPEFADSSNVFLANEFTPDGEHEDEWTALYALGSKTA